jgi:hypothetical protein
VQPVTSGCPQTAGAGDDRHSGLTGSTPERPCGAPPRSGFRSIPSRYLLGTEDPAIPPAAQRFMAERGGSTSQELPASHASKRNNGRFLTCTGNLSRLDGTLLNPLPSRAPFVGGISSTPARFASSVGVFALLVVRQLFALAV